MKYWKEKLLYTDVISITRVVSMTSVNENFIRLKSNSC